MHQPDRSTAHAEPLLVISTNGSHGAGETPDSTEQLLSVLATEPLDRDFERFGNFCYRNPQTCVWLGKDQYRDTGPFYPGRDVWRFFGNFHRVSHVFTIDTDDADLAATLREAIRANQRRPDYLSQPKPVSRKARAQQVAA